MYETTIIESGMASLPSKVVVMFVQSLSILKFLIDASFEGADKSGLKYKKMKDYSTIRQRAKLAMSYTIRFHQRLPSITAIATNLKIIFVPSGDSDRGK